MQSERFGDQGLANFWSEYQKLSNPAPLIACAGPRPSIADR